MTMQIIQIATIELFVRRVQGIVSGKDAINIP
jgi:hypothetical protein